MFKVFPAWVVNGNKVPLIKGWQELATTDPEQIRLWQELYKNVLLWGIPTGPVNDILVLDVDAKSGGIETLNALSIPHTLAQRTRSGGYHYFFRYPKDGRRYGQRVGFLPGLDIRGDGGWAAYYGFLDPSAPIAEAPQWLLEKAIKAEAPPIQPGSLVKIDPQIAEGIIQTAVENVREAPPGESNDTLNREAFRLGQLVKAESVTYEYAYDVLYRAAIERGKPPYEAKATIESGLAGGGKNPITSPFGDQPPVPSFPIPAPPAPPERWTPGQFSRQDLLNTSHLRKPQLFKDWSSEDIVIITADGGTGKTTLKLYEAICLALGIPFLGFQPVQAGKTLYITGEDSSLKLGAMLGQMLRQMGLLTDAPGNKEAVDTILHSIRVKKEADMCLIERDRNGFIHINEKAFEKVMEAVEDFKPKMIVFDPISSFWGSENALNDMSRAVAKFMSRLVEASDACVVMINHMGKSSSQSKDMTQFAGRGGTGLPSNSRISRVLRPVFDEEFLQLTGEQLAENQSAMMCMVNKFTDGSPLYNKPFLILRNGHLFERKMLTPTKEREAEEQMSDVERVFTFIKEQRAADRYPTLPVIIGHFQTCGSPLSKERTRNAVKMLQFQPYLGEMVKAVDNPDPSVKDQAFVITDDQGVEV